VAHCSGNCALTAAASDAVCRTFLSELSYAQFGSRVSVGAHPMALLAARDLPHCWRRHIVIIQNRALLEMARSASTAQRTVILCRCSGVTYRRSRCFPVWLRDLQRLKYSYLISVLSVAALNAVVCSQWTGG